MGPIKSRLILKDFDRYSDRVYLLTRLSDIELNLFETYCKHIVYCNLYYFFIFLQTLYFYIIYILYTFMYLINIPSVTPPGGMLSTTHGNLLIKTGP